MSKNSNKFSNKNKQGILFCNLRVSTNFKTTQRTGIKKIIKSSKKIIITLNSTKMEDQRV